MHGFHIPLAALGALGLAPSLRLRMMEEKFRLNEENEGEEATKRFHAPPTQITPFFLRGLFAICASLLLLTIGWFATLQEHPELWVRTDGDRTIQESFDLPNDSIVWVTKKVTIIHHKEVTTFMFWVFREVDI